ncbi:hypothetical protein DL96DRAFT_1556280 [Flagelloscypha sp. PMI_526]|nr:hypothetical protein DL96DRAFT_1556280 [Flagelloscypha sp. PMI_526]
MLAVPTPQQPSLSAPELVPPNTEHQHHSIFPLRTHFHQLLPRHVTFHVRLQIHLLDSVPLVSGQFATKWKIKGGTTNGTATPNNKSGILHKVRRTSRRPSRPPSRQSTAGNEHEDDESSPESSSATEHSSNRRQNSYGPLGVSRTTTMDSKSSSKSILLNGTTTPDLLSDDYPTPSLTSASTSDSLPSSLPTSLTSSSTPTEYISRPRGITPFRPLRDHSVTWEHTLDSIVKMDVDRDSKDLLSSYLKLSVMQEVIPGDLDAPQNPKLGELHLNLAEYAGAGPNGDGKNGGATSVNRVTRRYLLEQSKTNATLKLTLEMERISGEMDFIPPPLPKDQIFAGVGALLENEVYQERPEALDYFVPANSRPPAMGSRTVSKSSTKSSSSRSSEQPTPTFDIEKLSFATGPQTTESLIDALFNPTRVTGSAESQPSHIL